MPDPTLTLKQAALSRPGRSRRSPYYLQTLDALGKQFKFRLDTPFERACRKKSATCILYGSKGEESVRFSPMPTACVPMR